ncbi:MULTISPECIES: 1,4-alpha-glucan branching protein GlgB [unclassified Arthrobacter]|uniref:1,4-alpha-glucan branching protein GlgB n=1 Tax=unclassified Arthrobacter TaxID=235627 RepID=UPI001D13DAA1|nr:MULTISPECIES: 1,4-alpha-glucan branching protein GlgB [unclassified Arthrobacter]MCC3276498.1 1,4-alpha-glucan branching protein GlgB [Arthrobacter sp. zg-Y20]MCC9178516.1 1,4-alpha-glucan branching protein GlgB [Arthrobacter sp. zg-Y750]MDK1316658.1 1,4-alpha-glucan branching protein GlgB [Arthrobacter sp. zg.Y20]WIB06693.1 1,4-alpha-glucan branching protein GlgB [Arthrobacter sp. zg-Y20]
MTQLNPSLPEILTSWLPGQRWFPAKGRDVLLERVGGIRLEDPDGEVGMEVHLIAVVSGDRRDVISVPVSYRSNAAPELEASLLGRAHHEELGERWLYDATADPVFVTAWLELMRAQASSLDGHTHGFAQDGFEDWEPFVEPLPTKLLKGEQSNTSVVVQAPEAPLIVKFYRVVAAGVSPDVEVSARLTEVGSVDVPATYGWVTGTWKDIADETGETLLTGHLSVLREFFPGSQDAWRIASAAALEGRDFSAEAEELGAATGRIHQQLAAAFGSRPPSAIERAEFLSALSARIRWAWKEAGETVGPFADAVEYLLEQLGNLQTLPNLQRIHADYHLGQVLRAPERGWIVLDFEGEPLRPAAERSVPDAPLRDVVGMLRSIDYAAGVALIDGAAGEDAAGEEYGADAVQRNEAAYRWAAAASDAFLRGYEKETGTAINRSDPLFLALWLDKALYEVVYEIRNRPRWVSVPAKAVRQILAQAENAMRADDDSQEESTMNKPRKPRSAAATAEPEAPDVPAAGNPDTAAPAPAPVPVTEDVLQAVSEGRYYQPHAVLGAHANESGTVTIRTLRPLAQEVVAVTPDGRLPLRHEYNGIWVGALQAGTPGTVPDYRVEVTYDGGEPQMFDDPYRFLPSLGDMDLHLIGEGRHENLWTVLGANLHHYNSVLGDIHGVSFAVWAPNAQAVRVKGDFNGWNGAINAMRSLGGSGVWELFLPGVEPGARYKYEILGSDGVWREKADPMAKGTEVPPLTGSRVVESTYTFEDAEWMEARAARDPHNSPMSVYEVHLGSWRLGLNYREMADQLAEYVAWQGFTHVEFMPVAEHPFGGSWGYQVTSYFAPTARFGHPDEFRYLVDRLHQAGIGVILDWVPAHFPKDSWALAKFDGQTLYEHGDPLRGEQPDWGTLIFDYGRREVRNFLVANALYWLEEFHIDGLRVDAVASMLYLDYSRPADQWRPNAFGGRENLEAISFLQEVNATAYKRVPGIVMIAEESTAFPGVTRPTSTGGLGFGLKWNMGWMHDTLEYMAEDPINRVYHHAKLTFSLVYAYTENFLLPISHDEVVHGKGSLLRKMPGDRWQQLANLRAYLAFQWAHPGKQLIFMGTEFGQEAEWSEQYGLDWYLTDTPQHKGIQLMVKQLNEIYRNTPALSDRDNEPAGFQWINENDGAHNVLSFIRWDHQGNPLVCVANFAGAPHENFRLGMPWSGEWVEALNTDAAEFGGSGVGNMGVVQAVEGACNGQPASATLTVPPLGVLYLMPKQ